MGPKNQYRLLKVALKNKSKRTRNKQLGSSVEKCTTKYHDLKTFWTLIKKKNKDNKKTNKATFNKEQQINNRQ